MSGLSTERMEFSSLICFVANKPLPDSAVGLDVTLLFSMCCLKGAILENGNRADANALSFANEVEEDVSGKKTWW